MLLRKRRAAQASMCKGQPKFEMRVAIGEPMSTTHLDQALAEEFADKAEAIHALKVSNPHFRTLLEQNHDLWKQIQQIQKGIAAAEDSVLEDLEKRRLNLLDQIAAQIA